MPGAVSELGAASLGFMLACHCHLTSSFKNVFGFHIPLFSLFPFSIMATTHSIPSALNVFAPLDIKKREERKRRAWHHKRGQHSHAGPFEITCNKIDAQANIMRMRELPLHQFVHYCKHIELNIFLSTACVQYKPVYVLTFFLP